MQAIGTAGLSAAGRYVATPATAPGVLLTGGASPAAPAAIAAPTAPPAIQPDDLSGVADQPIAVDLVAPGIEELAGAKALAARSAIPIAVNEKTPSVGDVIATIDEPVAERSAGLIAKRDKLRADLIAGKGDPKQVVRILDDLDFVIKLVQRSEEKKRLLKELMKKLMMGVLTPTLIRLAKSLGLTGFLKDAIRQMLKGGNISPQQAKAMSTMLQTAGIQMPELDEFVLRYEKNQQQITDAARAARGLQPVQPDKGGSASTGSAIAGVRTLGVPPASSLT
jgi:hypothetical protein